jgi:hypothetical protein
MVLCNKKHSKIVHNNGTCPLCNLTEHNNLVHDFIESKGRDFVNELVSFLNSKNSELSEVLNPAPNTLRDAILLLEECHKLFHPCSKEMVTLGCTCLHCRVERFISQNYTR